MFQGMHNYVFEIDGSWTIFLSQNFVQHKIVQERFFTTNFVSCFQFFWALVHFFSSLQFILPNSPSRISWSILSWEVAITWSFYLFLNLSQANETDGSSPMELEGAKRAFSYLQSVGIAVVVFILDRHRGIAKWTRESEPGCAHFFDIWHIAQSTGKKMLQLGKEKGCEEIADWVKGVHNHLYC